MIKKLRYIVFATLLTFSFSGCSDKTEVNTTSDTLVVMDTAESTSIASDVEVQSNHFSSIELYNIDWFNGDAYVYVNNNVPYFTNAEKVTDVFEEYSELDSLGRCGVAYANICKDIMPTEARGEIGQIRPSGWHTVKYDIINGKYLYNRCHLIGFQLAGENANNKNLITGTRYLNIDGMLEHENEIADYVNKTGNHVLYRVTPVFTDDNIVADGVLMEGYSVEDNGEGIEFCIFAYNVQPGVQINYKNGESCLDGETLETETTPEDVEEMAIEGNVETFIINQKTNKFHLENCSSVEKMNEDNKVTYIGYAEDLILEGFDPCGICKPDKK